MRLKLSITFLENEKLDTFCPLVSYKQLFLSSRMTTASRLNLFRNFTVIKKQFKNLNRRTY